jgi:uncharacterized protein (TIGR03067 family)
MKYPMMLAALAGCVLISAGTAQEAGNKDKEAMQGMWKMAKHTIAGVGQADDLVKQITVIIDGDKFTVKLDTDAIATGTIKLDPAKKPKHIDVTFLEGGQQGQTELGIYELTADSFKVCFLIGDDAAKKRPASFEADKDGTNMMVMQRQKK